MGNGGNQPTQATAVNLTPEQRELYGLAMPHLREFAARRPSPYPGSSVPGFDPLQTQGQEMAVGSAGTQGDVVQGAAEGNRLLTSSDILSPGSNPALQGHIDAAVRPIYSNLTERVLPATRSGAHQAGQFGSSRQAILESLAARDAAVAAGDTASRIASTGYGQGLDAMAKGIGLAPQTAGAQTMPALTVSGVGDVRQNLMRELLGENVSRWNYEQMLPLFMGQSLIQSASGMPPAGTTTTANNPQGSRLPAHLGGALSGAAAGSAFGLPGAAGGAILGGLLPFLR